MSTPLSTQANFEDLWTITQAMKHLGVKKTWLYEACSKNQVPHVRLGSSIRFEPDQLRAWLKTRRQGPGSSAPAAVLALPGGRR